MLKAPAHLGIGLVAEGPLPGGAAGGVTERAGGLRRVEKAETQEWE